ncbi:MAG: alpha-L-arabinofuranosidase [Limisphaerales bacterium]
MLSRSWFALAGAALLALASPALANDDMLIYSGYTNVVYGTITYNNGWQDWGWVPHYATNNPSFGGTNSIFFAANNTWQAWSLEHDPINTTLYTNLSLWLNGGPGGGQTVGIQAEAGSTWGNQISVTAPTNTWQQFTIPLAQLGVGNVTNLEDIEIWNGGTPQADFYIAGITLTANPPPAVVHVSVNATNTVRTVDNRVFAVNTAAWDGDLDTTNTFSILTNIDNQALRWPGGSWGDIYFMTNEPQGWGSRTTNFLHVATNTGAQMFFIVNYGSGTPQQAADWVRFCEVTNHCYVKYWEVGNECYGGWEEDVNTNPPYQAQDSWTYAQRFTTYYNQMKAADPTIKIGAVASPGEDDYSNYTNHPVVNPVTGVTHNGWTPVMLTYLRSNNVTPDFLICHDYAPGDGDTYNLLWTQTWAVNASGLRMMLNDYLGTNLAANVELNDTEFGPEADKQWISLVGGLFYADCIGQILQTEFNTLLWWDLRNGQGVITDSDNALYGWRTNSSGDFLTDEGVANGIATPPNLYPSFYCMKLMQYFARGGDTVVDATYDYPLLSAYAVRRTNGCLTMLVVNKSSYASLDAAINLAGYVPFTNAAVYSYGIPQDNADRTGVGSPDVAQANIAVAGTNFNQTFAPYSATVLVFNPAAPKLVVPAAKPPTGKFVFQLQGSEGVPYLIQTSTNLASTNWTVLSTNTPSSGTLNLTNAASSGAQFYRAVWRP